MTTDMHAVPEHLPPLPEGAVYLGRGPIPTPDRDIRNEEIFTVRHDQHCGFSHCFQWESCQAVMADMGVPDDPEFVGGSRLWHYAAPLESDITRHILAYRVPDGVPVLPEGFVYAGRLGDYDGCEPLPGITFDPLDLNWHNPGRLSSWFGVGAYRGTGLWHYACPIESPLARKLLGLEPDTDDEGKFDREAKPNPKAAYWQERAAFWRGEALRLGYVPESERDTRPSWEDAPDWAEWLAQDENGRWFWYESQPTILEDFEGRWMNRTETHNHKYSPAAPTGSQPNPNWAATLEPRPAQEGHGTTRGDCDAKSEAIREAIEVTAPEREVANLSLIIDASDVERALKKALDGLERKLPSMLPDAPDLVIPKDAAEAMCGYSWIEELAEAGYRIEVDEHGLRGWKE